MGLFNRNKEQEKTYTFKEVTRLIQTKGYEDYVAIPVGDSKYLFVLEQREQNYNAHKEFVNRMSNNGAYANNRSYNNYQSAKRYNPYRVLDIR